MQKKTVFLVAVSCVLVCCVLAICLLFINCSSFSKSETAFVNQTWELRSVTGEKEITTEQTSELKENGTSYTIEFYQDGLYASNLFGVSKWDATSIDEGTLTIERLNEQETLNMRVVDGYLLISDDDNNIMKFTPEIWVKPPNDATPVVPGDYLVDSDICTITLLEPFVDVYQCGYKVKVENTSDIPLYITGDDEMFSINGEPIAPLIYIEVLPGKIAFDYITWDCKDIDSCCQVKETDLRDIEGTIEIINNDTGETLESCQIKID